MYRYLDFCNGLPAVFDGSFDHLELLLNRLVCADTPDRYSSRGTKLDANLCLNSAMNDPSVASWRSSTGSGLLVLSRQNVSRRNESKPQYTVVVLLKLLQSEAEL